MRPVVPPFKNYDFIVVNSSGGKDSMAALCAVVGSAGLQDYPKDKIVVSHQDLGRMEWEGTKDLVYKQAAHFGLEVIISAYRDKNGQATSLLEYIRQRGKWPSNTCRFCTSEFKRAPGGRVLTQIARERCGGKKTPRILNVYGFRCDESTSRSKKLILAPNKRFSSGRKEVWDYLPIFTWREEFVWDVIRPHKLWHHAYDIGMPRLSCRFCIFAPRAALLISGRANPELLDEYCAVEKEIGHTFRKDLSLCEIRDAIAAGEQPAKMDGTWNM